MQRRVKASVLLTAILFAFVWQTVHYHEIFHLHSDDFHLADFSETLDVSAHHPVSHDECLNCRLQRQFSNVVIFNPPSLIFSLEVKPVRVAVFFTAEFYRSTENLPPGGRAPPAPFLS